MGGETPAYFDLPLFRKMLAERNTHYCLHRGFVEKIKEVLQLKNISMLRRLVKDSMDLTETKDFANCVLNIIRMNEDDRETEPASESPDSPRLLALREKYFTKLEKDLLPTTTEERKGSLEEEEEESGSEEDEFENIRCHTIEDYDESDIL